MFSQALISQKRPHQFFPFLLKRASMRGLPSLPIPVASVPEVALLAVQVGMEPRALTGVDFLGNVVGSIPVTTGVVPEGEEQRPYRGRCGGSQAILKFRKSHAQKN